MRILKDLIYRPTKIGETDFDKESYNSIRLTLANEGIITDTYNFDEPKSLSDDDILTTEEVILILDEVEKRGTHALNNIFSSIITPKILSDDLLSSHEKQILLARLNKDVQPEFKEGMEDPIKLPEIIEDAIVSWAPLYDEEIFSVIQDLEKVSVESLGNDSGSDTESIL